MAGSFSSLYRNKKIFIQNATLQVPSQFATTTSALEFLQDKIIGDAVGIEIAPGTYNENLVIDSRIQGNIFLRSSSIIPHEGLTYVHAAKVPIVDSSPAQNPIPTIVGKGVVTLSNSSNNITVVGGDNNPDFSGAVGRKILIRNNSGSISELEITAVSSNVITLDTTAPSVGALGSAILIMPAVKISGDAGIGPSISVSDNPFLIKLSGLCIEMDVATNVGLQIINSKLEINNLSIYGTSTGIIIDLASLIKRSFPVSVWTAQNDGIAVYDQSHIYGIYSIVNAGIGSGNGMRIAKNSRAKLSYSNIGSIFLANTVDGISVDEASQADAHFCFSAKNLNKGFSASEGSQLTVIAATADSNIVGFSCVYGSRMQAANAISQNHTSFGFYANMASSISALDTTVANNGTDFDPPTSGVVDNLNSIIEHS